jgi:hypothetical protein
MTKISKEYLLVRINGNIEISCTIIPVELNKIIHHNLYDRYIKILSTADYMMPSIGILTEQALFLSLVTHPIVVIKSKRSPDHYQCIGGIRSLMLAKSSLASDEKLSVTLINRPSIAEIELIINADVLLSHILMSVKSPRTIGAIHQVMKKDEIEPLLNAGMHIKSKFAEKMGFAKNTIFAPNNSTVKSGNVS